MSNDKHYKCAVTDTDQLRAYETKDETFNGVQRDIFALVMLNAAGQKISVLLDDTAAEDLHAQLEQYCFGSRGEA